MIASLHGLALTPGSPASPLDSQERPVNHVMLKNLTIDSDLDMSGAVLGMGVSFDHCLVTGAISFEHSRLPQLSLCSMRVATSVSLAGASIAGDLDLRHTSARSVDLRDAHIAGRLVLSQMTVGTGPGKRVDSSAERANTNPDVEVAGAAEPSTAPARGRRAGEGPPPGVTAQPTALSQPSGVAQSVGPIPDRKKPGPADGVVAIDRVRVDGETLLDGLSADRVTSTAAALLGGVVLRGSRFPFDDQTGTLNAAKVGPGQETVKEQSASWELLLQVLGLSTALAAWVALVGGARLGPDCTMRVCPRCRLSSASGANGQS